MLNFSSKCSKSLPYVTSGIMDLGSGVLDLVSWIWRPVGSGGSVIYILLALPPAAGALLLLALQCFRAAPRSTAR